MAYLRLIRYKNLLMIAVTIILIKFFLIDSYTNSIHFSWLDFTLFTLSTLCFTAAGYAFNDVYDIKADKINKPHKYIVSKSISVRIAIQITTVLFAIGLASGLFVSNSIDQPFHILFLLVPFLLVVIYTLKLKSIPLLGNIVIALCAFWIFPLVYLFQISDVAATTVIGAILNAFNEAFIMAIIFYYGVFSFLITLIREVIKDIEDINGDYNMKMKTLPIIIGVKRARNFSIFLSFIFFILTVLTIKSLIDENEYIFSFYAIVCILLPTCYFIYRAWYAESKSEFKLLSKTLKLIMLFGILSMLFLKYM